MSTTVNTSRLPAKPRNKRLRYTGGMIAISAATAMGGGVSTPSYWDLINVDPDTGEVLEQSYIRSQYSTLVDVVDGYMQVGSKRLTEISASGILKLSNPDNTPAHFHATGDVVAYSVDGTNYLPIATTSSLGMVKVGANLTIAADGTLNATGGGGITALVPGIATGNAITSMTLSADGKTITYNKEYTFALNSALSAHVNDGTIHVTSTDKSNWNSAYNQAHTHSNKSYLDVINQGLGTGYSPTFNYLYTTNDVRASRDVIAYYSGGSSTLPIATTTILGMVKAGSGISIAADGTISTSGSSANNYLTSVTGSGNGIVTFARSGLSSLTWDASHTHSQYITGLSLTTSGSGNVVTNVTVSGSTITVTFGSISGGGVFSKVELWAGSTASVTATYTSGLAIRTGYVTFSGTLAAGATQVITLWNVNTSVLSCVASLRLPSGYGNWGMILAAQDNGAGYWQLVLYNSSTSAASVANVRAYYTAIMSA